MLYTSSEQRINTVVKHAYGKFGTVHSTLHGGLNGRGKKKERLGLVGPLERSRLFTRALSIVIVRSFIFFSSPGGLITWRRSLAMRRVKPFVDDRVTLPRAGRRYGLHGDRSRRHKTATRRHRPRFRLTYILVYNVCVCVRIMTRCGETEKSSFYITRPIVRIYLLLLYTS